MIKHIVFWRMKPEAEGRSGEENAQEMVRILLALKDTVPDLVEIDCGFDFNRSPVAFDVALYTTFKDREGLDRYQDHPEHVKAKDFIQKVTRDRAVVDYEV